MDKKSTVIVYTGDGKGKTTAAFGLAVRFLGWGKRVCVVQFLKSPDFPCGEKLFFEKLGIELYSTGIGYSWTKSVRQQREALRRAWELAKEKLADTSYDLVILDEINNVFAEKKFEVSDILTPQALFSLLEEGKSEKTVVLTGRNAPQAVIDRADLVTEMKCIRHPYDKGVEAQKGIEY